MYYVYSIETDNGYHYVGCTKRLRARMSAHKCNRDGVFPEGSQLDFVVLFQTESELEALRIEAAYIERAKLAYGDRCLNKNNYWIDVANSGATEPEELARFRLEKEGKLLPPSVADKTPVEGYSGPLRGWTKLEPTLARVRNKKGKWETILVW